MKICTVFLNMKIIEFENVPKKWLFLKKIINWIELEFEFELNMNWKMNRKLDWNFKNLNKKEGL